MMTQEHCVRDKTVTFSLYAIDVLVIVVLFQAIFPDLLNYLFSCFNFSCICL